MSGRLLLWISLAANVVLAGACFFFTRQTGFHFSRRSLGAPLVAATSTIRTNYVVNREFFMWAEVESDDYPTYISNLRYIGCPEQTIRDIIIADVNTLYAQKRSTEVAAPEQQWWRTEPDADLIRQAAAKLRDLDRERKDLLTRLLGANWESGDLVSLPRPTRAGIQLDGPVLGVLSTDVKQRVQEITAHSQERYQAYVAAQRQAGKGLDPAELARLRQQTRNELAEVLTPPQIEEFLLRYAQSASELRSRLGQIKFFNATPDEFRAMFHANDEVDLQLQALSGATDAASQAQRKSLEDQRDNAIRIALGPARYQQYVLLQDTNYQAAYASAVQAGTPEAAQAIYEINQATAQEQARLRGATNLTAEQLAYELKKIELDQLKASAEALGQDLPPDQPPLPPELPQIVHTYQAGESLDFLCRLYGVQQSSLVAANPDLDFSKLKTGQQVIIPSIVVRLPGP